VGYSKGGSIPFFDGGGLQTNQSGLSTFNTVSIEFSMCHTVSDELRPPQRLEGVSPIPSARGGLLIN
jgi:hypothetical protein